ncbi:MAG TPA: hypothetical protein VF042_13215, partial [Gemmatimonadaceae bacterium]
PVMNAADKRDWSGFQSSLLKAAIRFEKLEDLPTRFLTGHFIAIRATKLSPRVAAVVRSSPQ